MIDLASDFVLDPIGEQGDQQAEEDTTADHHRYPDQIIAERLSITSEVRA